MAAQSILLLRILPCCKAVGACSSLRRVAASGRVEVQGTSSMPALERGIFQHSQGGGPAMSPCRRHQRELATLSDYSRTGAAEGKTSGRQRPCGAGSADNHGLYQEEATSQR